MKFVKKTLIIIINILTFINRDELEKLGPFVTKFSFSENSKRIQVIHNKTGLSRWQYLLHKFKYLVFFSETQNCEYGCVQIIWHNAEDCPRTCFGDANLHVTECVKIRLPMINGYYYTLWSICNNYNRVILFIQNVFTYIFICLSYSLNC